MLFRSPASVQEAVDLTYAAFDYAQRDRNPVLILADGVLGTIMEPVVLPAMRSDEEVAAMKAAQRDWALVGHNPAEEERAFIKPGRWSTAAQEQACVDNEEMYASWENDIQVEEYLLDDAEVVLTAYGISGRIAKSAVMRLRNEGLKVGLIRPITVSPFPYGSFENLDYSRVKAILDVEMSIPAQMIFDVKLAVKDRCPIETCLRSGGEIMGREKVMAAARALCDKVGGK